VRSERLQKLNEVSLLFCGETETSNPVVMRVGSTFFSTTSLRWSVSVHSCSSAKVSKRKTRWPSAMSAADDSCLACGSAMAAAGVPSAAGFVVPQALSAVAAANIERGFTLTLMTQIHKINIAYIANRRPLNTGDLWE
jgi:hypothetical protein